VDYDSNRRLLPDAQGSDAGVISADLLFKHAVENLDYSLEPRYSFRRYTDSSLGNGDDRSIYSALNWLTETSSLNLTASYWDQSTLSTEVLETGIITGNTHRHLTQAGANYIWNQTERRSLLAQISYADVSYHGDLETVRLLPGYRNPTGSLGERFVINERSSFTVSANGSWLESDTQGNSSHTEGLQGEIIYAFSERTRLDAALGESSRVLSGKSSTGTDASISLTRTGELSRASVSYTRSLVPYGFGFFVQRQQYTASWTQPLTPFLSATLTGMRILNNETAVLLRVDRRSYESLGLSLNWRPYETWSVGAQIDGSRTELPDSTETRVQGWRAAVTLTWAPIRTSLSW